MLQPEKSFPQKTDYITLHASNTSRASPSFRIKTTGPKGPAGSSTYPDIILRSQLLCAVTLSYTIILFPELCVHDAASAWKGRGRIMCLGAPPPSPVSAQSSVSGEDFVDHAVYQIHPLHALLASQSSFVALSTAVILHLFV